jgi:uridine kinase
MIGLMLRAANVVRPAEPRANVIVRLPDGRTFEAPIGMRLAEMFRAIGSEPGQAPASPCAGGLRAVAALVNGRLRDLTTPLVEDAAVVPVTPQDADGARIYRQSLSFLLMTAAAEEFPGADVSIEHSATTVGAYFCEVRGHEPFTQVELRRIEARMRAIVEADEPIVRTPMPVAQAIEAVRVRGDEETARLLAHRQKENLVLYSLRGRQDYLQGYMVPSTGCLSHFALHAFAPGFFLQFPHQRTPRALPPIMPYPKLFQVYEEAGHWLDRLGIRGAGALNDAIAAGRLQEISLVGEALHEARIAGIAHDIAARGDRVRVVLVAGPSSSGKTTFSKRLLVQLVANGRRPMAICLDDYFVDREHTPRDARGGLDYECLGAVDVALFNEHLLRLMAGERVDLPRYVFRTGRREAGMTVTLGPDAIVIVEGIHGLNPALVPGLPPESVFRVYVSALTQLNLDRHNRVSTTDCRLVRRVVRDAASRGYSATDTLRRWESVTAGEKVHIFPYQENSDAIFNSALVHELAVLRPLAEPLLLQIQHDTREYLEAKRLLSFLQWFLPAPAGVVPDNSILREFVGGSILESFNPWLDHSYQPSVDEHGTSAVS